MWGANGDCKSRLVLKTVPVKVAESQYFLNNRTVMHSYNFAYCTQLNLVVRYIQISPVLHFVFVLWILHYPRGGIQCLIMFCMCWHVETKEGSV